MTIASKLALLQEDIVNARREITAKGGTIAPDGGSSQLAQDIATIPSVLSGITRVVDGNGVYGYPPSQFSFSLPSNARSLESGTLKDAFMGCTTITSVDLSSIVEIGGAETMESFCRDCTNLVSVDLSSLTTVNGDSVLENAFRGANITGPLDLSSLQTVSGSAAMAYAFTDNPGITSLDLSGLTSLPSNGVTMTAAFSMSLPQASPLPLSTVSFTSLSTINGTAPLRNIFSKRNGLQNVYFPALNSNSFGNLTTYLDNIIKDVDGCTVHFPSNMQAIIGNWNSVQNGFGGTNTTVLWDLPATT